MITVITILMHEKIHHFSTTSFLEALQNSSNTTKWRKFPIIMSLLLNGDMVTYRQVSEI